MKKLTTVIMVLSLVLGGVALAAAADLPQTSKNLDLSVMQKISDQEAKVIRGTAGFSVGGAFQFGSLTSPSTYGDRLQTRDRIQDPTPIQLRDGSCR
jgi:hypothetical protein